MAKLDVVWAVEEIDAFLCVTTQVVRDMGPDTAYFGTVMKGPKTEASARAHVVEQVPDLVLPSRSREQPEKDSECAWLRDLASRVMAALQPPRSLGGPGKRAAILSLGVFLGYDSQWRLRSLRRPLIGGFSHSETQSCGRMALMSEAPE